MQMANKMQIRRDSATNWTTTNPTLSQGELGYELNTGKLKIGNGVDAWVDLNYFDDQSFSGSYNDLADLPFSDPPNVADIAGAASETYVNNAITALKAGASSALDTLNELATALGNDANFSATVTSQLGLKANSADLSVVATSGAYADLLGKPTLFDGNYNSLTNKPTLFNGDYNNLSNKPTLFDGDYDSLTHKPTLFSGDYDDLTDKPTLFSGDYDDLTHKPTLFDGQYGSLTGKPNLATVATSGSYADLAGNPDVDKITVGDGTASNPSIAFGTDGSIDTGIYHPGDGIVCVSSNGTEKLRVDSGGARVNGFLKVAQVSGSLPNPPEAGMIVLDGTTFKGYNGSDWVNLN